MNDAGLQLFIITFLQFAAGMGILGMCRVTMPRSVAIPTSVILGMFVHSVAFFLASLLGIGVSLTTTTVTAVISAIVVNAPLPLTIPMWKGLLARPTWNVRMYDVMAWTLGAYILFIVVWGTWYWPVTPFDAMAGIDLVARQAIEEGTLNNSIYTHPSLAGRLSNQPFYAPFAMLHQVMTRTMGFAYGQLWLAVASVSFAVFFAAWLRRYVHPFIASATWLLILITPEWLGYQYLLQTDFINAVFVAMGAMFTIEAIRTSSASWLAVAVVLFAGGCWSRTETPIIVGFGLVLVFWPISKQLGQRTAVLFSAGTVAACSVIFALWHVIWFSVLPVRPDSLTELRIPDVTTFFTVLTDLFTNVLAEIGLWGWIFPLVVLAAIVSLICHKRLGLTLPWLWMGAIVLGLVLVGSIFSSAVVEQTLRRGIFKLVPLVGLALVTTSYVQQLSDRLMTWEGKRR